MDERKMGMDGWPGLVGWVDAWAGWMVGGWMEGMLDAKWREDGGMGGGGGGGGTRGMD